MGGLNIECNAGSGRTASFQWYWHGENWHACSLMRAATAAVLLSVSQKLLLSSDTSMSRFVMFFFILNYALIRTKIHNVLVYHEENGRKKLPILNQLLIWTAIQYQNWIPLPPSKSYTLKYIRKYSLDLKQKSNRFIETRTLLLKVRFARNASIFRSEYFYVGLN